MNYILATKDRQQIWSAADTLEHVESTAVPMTFKTPGLAMLSVNLETLRALQVVAFDEVYPNLCGEKPTTFDAVEMVDRFVDGSTIAELAAENQLHPLAVESIIRLVLLANSHDYITDEEAT